MKKYKIDFESFLQDKFMELNPQVLDDDLTDAFISWLTDVDIDDCISYGQEYAHFVKIKTINEIRDIVIEPIFNGQESDILYEQQKGK
jgi:predicted PolB exonuclease-like 3'-5' exonuclease